MSTIDTVNSFVAEVRIDGTAAGLLEGHTFVAKDIFDIAGHVTGCGNPDWARTHPPATANAAAVDAFLGAGANLVAKTHTDELAYSLIGANAHYGTPVNTAAPDRVPGGSSSGSAAAVAAGLADLGLGSDTGGSVRLPASFCGLFGLRTTHGRVPLDGAMALAPSFDTVGWFARDPATMEAAALACGCGPTGWRPRRLLLAVDAWAKADAEVVDALAPALARLEARFGAAVPVRLAPEGLETWRETFRVCQAAEVWQVHGAWVEATTPRFGPGVEGRFLAASSITEAAWSAARDQREAVRRRLDRLMGTDGLLILPTAPGPAPLRDAAEPELDAYRGRALELLCPAGLAGLPQLSVPGAHAGGGPVGLGLVGPAGRDGDLLAVAADACAPS